MTRILASLALVVALFAAGQGPVRAEEGAGTRTVVDELFESLAVATDEAAARHIEDRIWAFWYTYPGTDSAIPNLMRRGQTALAIRALDTAETVFDEIIRRDPDYAEGWNRRATVRYLKGDYEGSIADIRATVALEPRHFGAWSGLGLCYIAIDRPDLAIAAFRRGLEIDPFLAGARQHIELLEERLSGDPI